MAKDGIGLEDLDEALAPELIAGAEAFKARKIKAAFIAKRFVGWLAEQGLAKPPPVPTPSRRTWRASLLARASARS